MKKINKKGFTLIELLAVIVILGVIMVIAVPAVTKYIDNSRKDSFVSSAKMYVNAVQTKVSNGEITVADGETEKIYVNTIELQKGGTSPYGVDYDPLKSYVGVTNDGEDYSYEIVLVDKKGNCIPKTSLKDLKGNIVTSSCSEVVGITTKKDVAINVDTDKQTLMDTKVYGNTVEGNKVGSDGTVDLVVTGKNLYNVNKFYWFTVWNGGPSVMDVFKNSDTTTLDGITYTKNSDGSVTVSGSRIDTTKGMALYNSSSRINPSSLIIKPGNFTLSVTAKYEDDTDVNVIAYPNVYINNYVGGVQNKNGGHGVNVGTKKTVRNYTTEEIYSSGYKNDYGLWFGIGNNLTRTMTMYPQFEYGSTSTSYEPYKEQRYVLELKDTSGNVINGLGTGETIEKKNGKWGISTESTFTELISTTQSKLNSIRLYDGVSNIFVDDAVRVSNIEIKYYQ